MGFGTTIRFHLIHSGKFESRLWFKERVRQINCVDVFKERIVDVVGIDVEEDWHVYFFIRVEPLLLKAEALNLVEILAGLKRNDVVCAEKVAGSIQFSTALCHVYFFFECNSVFLFGLRYKTTSRCWELYIKHTCWFERLPPKDIKEHWCITNSIYRLFSWIFGRVKCERRFARVNFNMTLKVVFLSNLKFFCIE